VNSLVVSVTDILIGYNWDEDVTRDYPVRLEGFSTCEENTIEITGLYNGQSAYAPDIDRIGMPC
jgi:alpha-galactosidase